jgi:EAL domain-containing protein (putative c-di-GMP-specific phosphodiesterase class I)
MCERVALAFESPLSLQQQNVDISASMGVASSIGNVQDEVDADALMGRAEIAMRVAKARTTGLCIYEPALDSTSNQTLSLLTDLRQALEQDHLRLFVQPKIAVTSGQVVALEALVRWAHPQRGLVPPMDFIPFAEQTGFVRQLTLWMLHETCRQWPGLQRPEQAVRVAINLSTRDLMDQDFSIRVSDILRQHGVPSSGLCLEITESAIMDDPQRALNTLNKLAELGFKLSIDDFGTGYSSLAYLKSLPVSELKIDKSFVMGMESDVNDAKIVRSTIDLAHNLGLTVVAEGVENARILQHLHQLQCDEAQGYHIGKPMPVQDFARWHTGWLERNN